MVTPSLLGPSWAVLGASWAAVGAPWAVSGLSWADRTGQHKTGQDRTAQDRTAQDSTRGTVDHIRKQQKPQIGNLRENVSTPSLGIGLHMGSWACDLVDIIISYSNKTPSWQIEGNFSTPLLGIVLIRGCLACEPRPLWELWTWNIPTRNSSGNP